MILPLLTFSVILITITPSAEANCTRVCSGGGRQNSVQFPFGFSGDCEIRLNCSDGKLKFGRYDIQNLTTDHIQINLPSKCDRGFDEIRSFVGPNFALTSRNGLLLENCHSALNDCMVSTSLVENHFNLEQCNTSATNRSMNCYSEENADKEDFMNLTRLNSAGCKVLFSSVTVDLNGMGSGSAPTSLEFQSVQLGWWKTGECGCDPNADCRNVTVGDMKVGHRCHCIEGFDGDGFSEGNGCRQGNPKLCQDSECKSSRGTRKVVVISIAVIVSLLAILVSVLAFIFYLFRRKNKSIMDNSDSFKGRHEMVRYNQLRSATGNFNQENLIGRGSFGSVYKGCLTLEGRVREIAVKVLDMETTGSMPSFLAECAALRHLRHKNLLKLITSCSSLDHKNMEFLALVYEYMKNGSLEKWIGNGMGLLERLKVAIDVACGLAYLHHECVVAPVVHCDLKPSNVLLDDDFTAKIGDFGLASLLIDKDQSISSTHVLKGSMGYIPPEYGMGAKPSTKGDVYSYGIMVLEIFTRK